MPILSYISLKGLSIEKCLSDVGFDENIISNVDNMISTEEVNSIIQSASRICNDDMIGIHSGVATEVSRLGLLGQLLMNSHSLKEVMETYRKYNILLCDSLFFDIDDNKKELTLRFKPAEWRDIDRNLVDALFCTILSICRKLINMNFYPKNVFLTSSRPNNYKEYLEVYNVVPAFNSNENKIIFSSDILNYKVICARPEIRLLLEEEVKRKLLKIKTNGMLKSKLISNIMTSLPVRIPTIEEAAESLNMSKRGIQKKLADEGTNFRDIIQGIRIGLADRYLFTGNYTVSEVAYLTGFSEESSFIRFYKRIKGITPGVSIKNVK